MDSAFSMGAIMGNLVVDMKSQTGWIQIAVLFCRKQIITGIESIHKMQMLYEGSLCGWLFFYCYLAHLVE